MSLQSTPDGRQSTESTAIMYRRPAFPILIFVCVAITAISAFYFHWTHGLQTGLLQRIAKGLFIPQHLTHGPTIRTSSVPLRHVIGKMRMSGGRLDNEMFVYASVLGIAARNNMTPVYHSHRLRATFTTTASQQVISSHHRHSVVMHEHSAIEYDIRFDQLSRTTDGDVTIVGFFQSWKYFRGMRSRVLSEFQFLSPIRKVADNFLRDIAAKLRLENGVDVQYIGVHIERKNMLSDEMRRRGYTVADDDYLIKAVSYINRQFPPSTRLVYVVCRHEMDWAKIHFTAAVSKAADITSSDNRTAIQLTKHFGHYSKMRSANSVDMVYSEGHNAEEDLAILSSCNHTIMTVGTFGWWAGYLAGGITVYYRNLPARNSELEKRFSREDFFPEDWVGL